MTPRALRTSDPLPMMATAAREDSVDPALLALLRCPVSHQPLQLLAPEEARRLGLPAQPLLMREDGRVYYRFEEHGFPLLLPGSGITVTDAGDDPVAD